MWRAKPADVFCEGTSRLTTSDWRIIDGVVGIVVVAVVEWPYFSVTNTWILRNKVYIFNHLSQTILVQIASVFCLHSNDSLSFGNWMTQMMSASNVHYFMLRYALSPQMRNSLANARIHRSENPLFLISLKQGLPLTYNQCERKCGQPLSHNPLNSFFMVRQIHNRGAVLLRSFTLIHKILIFEYSFARTLTWKTRVSTLLSVASNTEKTTQLRSVSELYVCKLDIRQYVCTN